MNKKILASRYIQVISFVIILMLILCIRLFVLTVVQEEKWAEAAKNQNTKEVLLSAPRGQIFDRYGRFSPSPSTPAVCPQSRSTLPRTKPSDYWKKTGTPM